MEREAGGEEWGTMAPGSDGEGGRTGTQSALIPPGAGLSLHLPSHSHPALGAWSLSLSPFLMRWVAWFPQPQAASPSLVASKKGGWEDLAPRVARGHGSLQCPLSQLVTPGISATKPTVFWGPRPPRREGLSLFAQSESLHLCSHALSLPRKPSRSAQRS